MAKAPEITLVAGRPPGEVAARHTKSRSQQQVWEEIVGTFGDPLTELAKIAFNPQLDVKIRKDALKELTQYGHSKRRSVEITGADGAPLEMRLKMISDIAESIAGSK